MGGDASGMPRLKYRIAKLVSIFKTQGLSYTVRRYADIATMPIRSSFSLTAATVKALGIVGATQYLQEKKHNMLLLQKKAGSDHGNFTLAAPGLLHPVVGRRGSSDLFVYEQIFVQREYSCLPLMGEVQTIVDCGANVGYASAYMLSHFPDARLVAIEPDSGNFAMLKENIAPYGERAEVLQAGVWSHPADLMVCREARGGEQWAFTVNECGPDDTPDVRAVGVQEIMTRFQMEYIDILKVDIEGSEKEVFGANYDQWINKVRLLVTELHGPDCETAVQKAVAHRKHTVTRFEELTVFHFLDGNDATPPATK